MNKRKTKLVCVGWGVILWPFDNNPQISSHSCNEADAILKFDEDKAEFYKYKRLKESKDAIAKKLWVEVKDE